MGNLTQSEKEKVAREHPGVDAYFVIGKEERDEGHSRHFHLTLFNPKHGTLAVSKINHDEYALIQLGQVMVQHI